MSPTKFEALADKIHHRRVDHENRHPLSEACLAPSKSLRLRAEPSSPQLALPFTAATSIEVFHRLDPASREIEWSYYSNHGEFLLHFLFDLKKKQYHVVSMSQALQAQAERYLPCLQEDLGAIYPGLELAQVPGVGPVIRPRKKEEV